MLYMDNVLILSSAPPMKTVRGGLNMIYVNKKGMLEIREDGNAVGVPGEEYEYISLDSLDESDEASVVLSSIFSSEQNPRTSS